jgi:vitamin B12 transporter
VPARVRGFAADLLDPAELERRQLVRLVDALRLLPGSGLVGTGGLGGTASTFLRGVNSNQTLFLIDGIRINDANAVPGAFLGGFELEPADRIEVARGPQSTSFGGAAIGGVIALAPRLGSIENRVGAETEAGSFRTFRARGFGSARAGRLGISASASLIDTDNQRASNQFDQRTESFRAEYQAAAGWTLGATARGLQQSFTSPGDIRTSNSTPVGLSTFDQTLATVFVDGAVTPRWGTRLTLGGQGYFLEGRSRFNGGDEFVSRLKATRWVADWQNRWDWSRSVTAMAGVNAEWADVTDPDGLKQERLRAGYGELVVAPTVNLHLSAGARHDDYSTFGGRTTGRVTAAWFVPAMSLKLRATYGTGFMPPSLAARYGSIFQQPNREIRPERSRGFDAGVDRFFAAGRGVASLTFFHTSLIDLIGFELGGPPDFLGRNVNLDRARTAGVELAARAELGPLDTRASYTYLDAENLSAPSPDERRLIRRPRHTFASDVSWSRGRVVVGLGATAALDRQDTDFTVFPAVPVDPGDYLDARLYAQWSVGRGLRVRARAENLFNERYEEAYGFPVLGRRFTVGLAFDRRQ